MASIQYKAAKNGKKVYYVVVAHGATRKWLKAGTLSNARALKKEIDSLENSKRADKLGLAPKSKRIDSFFEEYAEYVRLRTSANTLKRYKAALNAFIAFLNMFYPRLVRLSQITPEIIEDFQHKRLESIELKTAADGDKPGNHKKKRLPLPQTVNYEVGVLRSAFIWAQDRGLLGAVPTHKVKNLRPKPKRQARLLSVQECEDLLNKAKEIAGQDERFRVFSLAFGFLLNTGLRSGELCNLTWEDVDLESGVIEIRPKEGWTPKSYSREFFLNQTCLDLLESIENRVGYIFKAHTGRQLSTDDLRRALIRLAKLTGIQGLTRVHDLRHTFSSLMQMNGVDRGTVATILGHRDLSTTLIYTHQSAEHLKKSIGKIRLG